MPSDDAVRHQLRLSKTINKVCTPGGTGVVPRPGRRTRRFHWHRRAGRHGLELLLRTGQVLGRGDILIRRMITGSESDTQLDVVRTEMLAFAKAVGRLTADATEHVVLPEHRRGDMLPVRQMVPR